MTGAYFDLKPLIIPSDSTPYHILDGGTSEVEAAYSYVWNFCTEIADEYVPQPCKDKGKSSAVAFQYINYAENSDCYVIGNYNPANDDLDFKLLDDQDPTKGVSITYALGEKCQSNSRMRSATIDVQCANVENVILSAQEPLKCEYHMVMQSYHGCPTVSASCRKEGSYLLLYVFIVCVIRNVQSLKMGYVIPTGTAPSTLRARSLTATATPATREAPAPSPVAAAVAMTASTTDSRCK